MQESDSRNILKSSQAVSYDESPFFFLTDAGVVLLLRLYLMERSAYTFTWRNVRMKIKKKISDGCFVCYNNSGVREIAAEEWLRSLICI